MGVRGVKPKFNSIFESSDVWAACSLLHRYGLRSSFPRDLTIVVSVRPRGVWGCGGCGGRGEGLYLLGCLSHGILRLHRADCSSREGGNNA